MNLPPRQQQILELVRERGYVSIEELLLARGQIHGRSFGAAGQILQ